MAYVTHAQLALNPGAYELAQVATDEQRRNPVNADLLALALRDAVADVSTWPAEDVAAANAAISRIGAAVAEADGLIDAYLAKRGYTLPLSPVPVVIASKARDIVRYLLHKNRISGESEDPITRDYKIAIAFLERIASGKIGLEMADCVAVSETGAATAAPVQTVGIAHGVNSCDYWRSWQGGWI